MEEKKTRSDAKLPYEELERIAMQLNGQCHDLQQRLVQEQDNNVWGRLSILMECVSHADVFEDKVFIGKCCDEIKSKLYPAEKKEG